MKGIEGFYCSSLTHFQSYLNALLEMENKFEEQLDKHEALANVTNRRILPKASRFGDPIKEKANKLTMAK